MLSVKQAINIAKKKYPRGNIESLIVYNGLYVFKITNDDELEGDMDPFYSVDIMSGEFRDFSIITDGNIVEITKLFRESDILKTN